MPFCKGCLDFRQMRCLSNRDIQGSSTIRAHRLTVRYHWYGPDTRCALVKCKIEEILRRHPEWSLRANNDETLTAAIITEQGGKENHRERDQDGGSFCRQCT
jgi:hypothetical protein